MLYDKAEPRNQYTSLGYNIYSEIKVIKGSTENLESRIISSQVSQPLAPCERNNVQTHWRRLVSNIGGTKILMEGKEWQ